MLKRKHILFIVENNSFPTDIRVKAEADVARECGYEVTVITPSSGVDSLKYEQIDGMEVFRHPRFEGGSKLYFIFEYFNALMWELILSIKVFLRKPFHIIHGANPPDHLFLVALIFKLFGTKYIFDHHDITPENYVAKFGRKDLFTSILLLMEKLNFMVADLVVSTNESYKKIAVTRGMKKENDVFVVRNGPVLNKITWMPSNENIKEGFDYLVAYTGGIGEQDAIDVLLRTVDYIVNVRKITNIKFIVVGTGSNWANMVKLGNKLGLQDFVRFTGFIPWRDLYEILATADVCVNPEFRNDFTDKSTMIKIMDYMTFGKPIVQFNVTEGRVTAENASIYVENNSESDFAESIVTLLHNPGQRRRMGEIGKRRIQELLNWDKQKENLIRAYEYLESR